VTSSLDPISFGLGETTASYTLTFDEPVLLAEGAISIDNGATITGPTLPAEGTEFEVTLADLDDRLLYSLSVVGEAVTDTCGNALEPDTSVELVGACTRDLIPVTLTSPEYFQRDAFTTGTDITLEFDEPVQLDVGDIAIENANLVSVDPPLPSTSATFTVHVENLTGVHAVTVSGVADACGNLSDETVWVCVGTEVAFEFTGGEQIFTVPACTEGQVTLEVLGAEGRPGSNAGASSAGRGGQAIGNLVVDTGETLYVRVGGQDGYNGGGSAGVGNANTSGNGGGASDVRLGNNALSDRVIVGGGGGGGAGEGELECIIATPGAGGAGGYESGTSGGNTTAECYTLFSIGGGGGSQTSGGTGGSGTYNCNVPSGAGDEGELGMGGDRGAGNDCNGSGYTGAGGGGGGGGYYGGGGGGGGPGSSGTSWPGAGGGGGSSYIGGVQGGAVFNGTRQGNGRVIISW